ncbi:dynein heavy chain [Cryptosporidium canis]|uniref:Dynein heavy chain n=1 Tax=Cryptosporidium canis TaxID=195482 RepID=A0ABQ8P449_9CRYT|nr:dynein heavy chain [Cryptosporidium canis]KAJ1606277.1 dynein heavy chain [Cryptosporidium canis]
MSQRAKTSLINFLLEVVPSALDCSRQQLTSLLTGKGDDQLKRFLREADVHCLIVGKEVVESDVGGESSPDGLKLEESISGENRLDYSDGPAQHKVFIETYMTSRCLKASLMVFVKNPGFQVSEDGIITTSADRGAEQAEPAAGESPEDHSKGPGAASHMKSLSSSMQCIQLGFVGSQLTPYEVLNQYLQFAFTPLLDVLGNAKGASGAIGGESGESGDPGEAGSRLGLDNIQRKVNELCLALQQGQDDSMIPMVRLSLDSRVSEYAKEYKSTGKVGDIDEIMEDSAFLSSLQVSITQWIREIQSLARFQRDIGLSVTSEVKFWSSYERSLLQIQKQVQSPEVEWTLSVLRQSKKFLAAISLEVDTGLKQSIERVQNINTLIHDIPINDLLVATSIDEITSALGVLERHEQADLQGAQQQPHHVLDAAGVPCLRAPEEGALGKGPSEDGLCPCASNPASQRHRGLQEAAPEAQGHAFGAFVAELGTGCSPIPGKEGSPAGLRLRCEHQHPGPLGGRAGDLGGREAGLQQQGGRLRDAADQAAKGAAEWECRGGVPEHPFGQGPVRLPAAPAEIPEPVPEERGVPVLLSQGHPEHRGDAGLVPLAPGADPEHLPQAGGHLRAKLGVRESGSQGQDGRRPHHLQDPPEPDRGLLAPAEKGRQDDLRPEQAGTGVDEERQHRELGLRAGLHDRLRRALPVQGSKNHSVLCLQGAVQRQGSGGRAKAPVPLHLAPELPVHQLDEDRHPAGGGAREADLPAANSVQTGGLQCDSGGYRPELVLRPTGGLHQEVLRRGGHTGAEVRGRDDPGRAALRAGFPDQEHPGEQGARGPGGSSEQDHVQVRGVPVPPAGLQNRLPVLLGPSHPVVSAPEAQGVRRAVDPPVHVHRGSRGRPVPPRPDGVSEQQGR